MTLKTHEFIRRFLIHTLPNGLHRIRLCGSFASGMKVKNLGRMRELLGVAGTVVGDATTDGNDAASSEDYLVQSIRSRQQ